MICRRSTKHAIGEEKNKTISQISEGEMFVPPIDYYTDFLVGSTVVVLSNNYQCIYESFPTSVYSVPPAGTVFTITQDKLK